MTDRLSTRPEAQALPTVSGEAGPNAAYPWQVYAPSEPGGNYDIGGPPERVGDHQGFLCIATVFGGKVDAEYICALHNAALSTRPEAQSLSTVSGEGSVTLNAIADMMGEFVDNWPKPKKVSTALALIAKTMRAALDPPKHKYWGAGEPDCPPEIKAGNGELHTLRCKVCGKDDPRDDRCLAALSPTVSEADEAVERCSALIHGAMVWAAKQRGEPKPWQNGNSTAEDQARLVAGSILAALRAQPSNEAQGWREAFKLLADLHDAIALTSEYNPHTSVGSLADCSAEFQRAREFLHRHQYNDLEASVQAGGEVEGWPRCLADIADALRDVPDECFRRIAQAKDVASCRSRIAAMLLVSGLRIARAALNPEGSDHAG